ncbi:MAG TPA: efflux RND transporter periplasmic adaptor subunit [Terriglobia bacterium]|nr:efflux RND transporter periplasmic adaptor subunit [Terriglobia bacterium]
MDIPRTQAIKARRIKRVLYVLIGLILVSVTTVGLSRLKPAAPSVERSTVWLDTVKRGPMKREVHGMGTLVPLEIRWIPATTNGRIEKIIFRPGVSVTPNTVLIELSNPEVQQAALDAEWQLKAAQAELESLKVRLESQLLDQKAILAQAESSQRQDQLNAEKFGALAKEGLGSELNAKLSQAQSEGSAIRLEMEKQRMAISSESSKAQLAAQQAKVEQLQELLKLKRIQVESLHVRPGMEGVLQQVPVEVGQQVSPGANLARVADPKQLKAEIKIPETQAKDILNGQKAMIDTRNGVVSGHVIRIDPAVQNGTVTVDVALDEPLPKGARPDLSVDGVIELEHLDDVLFVGRPAFGQEKNVVGIFKLLEDGKTAQRTQVKLGRSSVNTIEIIDGLKIGDQVILSDMSAWDAYDRVRLN